MTLFFHIGTKLIRKIPKEEIKFFEKQYQIKASNLTNLYHIFQSIAVNGLMKIDKYIQFVSSFGENAQTEDINFLKKIFFYFDEDKTGLFKFGDFLKCMSLFNEEKDSFFKFLFDFADKDKNNTLDEDEIREIFVVMPVDILNNQNALEYALKKLKKSNGFLNRDQFLELIYKIKENRSDDESDEDDD
ncbi:hypothetical protein BpHYR1_045089 [Brachionus plicatilis]|uniref:EF-hand domain-containing protein n=1 Tax=Brachionus plicatilis TaxID=10195 RepID=A0A3M7T0D1_BRAPC|nr:hypothetical protein BpHYR1_045089 [Brachionus plicatilis]